MSQPAALILPHDPAFVSTDVGGLSLLLRSVCVFARCGVRVYVLRTPACSEATVPGLPHAVARREGIPPPVWVDRPDAVPTEAGLFVLRGPAVFDRRTVEAMRSHGSAPLTRADADSNAGAALWYANASAAPALLTAIADGTESPEIADGAITVSADSGLYAPITTPESVHGAESKLLAGTAKASDTFIARHFDRHISHWLTRRLMHTGITPNQVTLVSTLVGLTGVALLLAGTYGPQVVGAGLVLLATIIDGVDGEIARLRFLESNLGRNLDFWLDNVVNASALFATGAGYGFATGSDLYVWASVFNLVAAATTAVPIYFLFFRPGAVTAGGSRLEGVLTVFTGRDYAYLVFAMALLGIVHWFTWFCLAGLTTFMLATLALFVRRTYGSIASIARGD